jgi:DNA-binding response OmpR family regulator
MVIGRRRCEMEEIRGPILIVDDEEPLRNVLYRKLKAEGYDCEVASDGKEALRKVSMKEFALVLMDIRMPGMTGMEVLSKLIAEHPDIGVVMLTAVVDTKTAVEAMRQGAYDYITKPFDMDDLSIRVRRALERRRLVLENREYQHRLEQRVEQQVGQIRQYYQEALYALSREQMALEKLQAYRSQRTGNMSGEVIVEPSGLSRLDKESADEIAQLLGTATLDSLPNKKEAAPVTKETLEEAKEQHTVGQEEVWASGSIALYSGTVEIVLPPPMSLHQMLQLHERLRSIPNVKVLNLGGSVDKGITIRLFLDSDVPLIEILRRMPEVEKALDESVAPERIVPSREGETPQTRRVVVGLSKKPSTGHV